MTDTLSSLLSSSGEAHGAVPAFRKADLRFGTIVKLPDDRVGTVVYKGFDGYGIAWGEIEVCADDFRKAGEIGGHILPPVARDGMPIPGAQAMLRDQHDQLPAVGQKVYVVRHQLGPEYA